MDFCYTTVTAFLIAPVFHGLPISVNVGELEYNERLIYELSVTDVNNDDFNTYQVTIRCRDSNGEYSDDTVELDIIANERLEFTNIPRTGVITTTKDLKYETNSPVYLYITVSDGLIEVKEKFRVDIQKLAAVGTTLYTISGTDADAGETLSYSMHVDPVGETGKFTFDPLTGIVKSSGTFDYETRTYYNVTFNITDSKATSGPYVLDVYILNEEEPCYFVDSNYYMSAYEGNAGSLVNFNPNFLVRDYDGTSTWSLSLVNANNSGRFTMAGSTGLMNYAVNYDVDQNAMPSVVYLTAKCTDLTGQTGTTGLTIFIQDVNDNAPQFPQGVYTYAIDQYTALGTIATLSATDRDLTSNNNQYSCNGQTVSTTNIWYSIEPTWHMEQFYTPRRQVTPPSRRQVTPERRELEPRRGLLRRSYGRRDYLDYPQAVSPSDANLGLERTVPRLPIGKTPAIGYY
ncbi:hypothetical protein KUTeg_000862 [Tegillarca granosa]|uniref:Cadherin domain-containing protein n=1 Tax=Tegillarca granosa TaxID=220873 RepID=A0ABQ9G1X2_TEGGR|nr:hypothetical protein KUTeg_000862 [Tegillarca granosa]